MNLKLPSCMTLICCVLCACQLCKSANAQEPVLHYTFDEMEGNAIDSGTGQEADGILFPTATRTANTPNNFSPFALDLSAEGVDSWVNGGDAAKIDTLTTFTMTTWLNLQGLNTDHGGSGNVRLLAKQAPDPFNGFSWNLNNPTEGERGADNFRMGMFVGGVDGFGFGQSTESLDADNKWIFVATTYDGNEEVDNLIFYSGDETTSVSQLGFETSVFAGQIVSSMDEATVNVGFTDAAPGIDFSVNGYQDDVRIYDTVLSAEQLDVIRLENLQPTIVGDLNGDGVTDVADIDALTEVVIGQTNLPNFDINGDGQVDTADRQVFVNEILNTYFGDANFDLEFNSSDLVAVFQPGEYEDGIDGNSTWATGDWNGDLEFDSGDFVTAFQSGGYEVGPRNNQLQNVPEPSFSICLWFAAIGLACKCRKRF